MIDLIADLAWGLAVVYAVAGVTGLLLGLGQLALIITAAALMRRTGR